MSLRKLTSNNLHLAAMAGLVILILISQANAAGATLSDGWIRRLPGDLPAAGYFTLHNGGAKSVALTGAESPLCGMLMLHKSENMGGMEHMSDVARVDVAPGETVKFAPGGYHLMCMMPAPALKPGGRASVTLIFADGTRLQSQFAVRGASGK